MQGLCGKKQSTLSRGKATKGERGAPGGPFSADTIRERKETYR